MEKINEKIQKFKQKKFFKKIVKLTNKRKNYQIIENFNELTKKIFFKIYFLQYRINETFI